MTRIEWCDETWNPFVGCSRVSEGCRHCYAERFAGRGLSERYRGLTEGGRWTGETRFIPEELARLRRWRKPRRVFVCSMSDLFHEANAPRDVASVLDACERSPRHRFYILTKRAERMAELLGRSTVIPNARVGVSIEDQRTADERLPYLGRLASAGWKTMASAEPLLGAIDLSWALTVSGISPVGWLIVGGESGPGARPMHPDWARSLRDQAVGSGVPFFFKQWGEWEPAEFRGVGTAYNRVSDGSISGHSATTKLHWWGGAYGDGQPVSARVGKQQAGRMIDGRTWDEVPE